MGVIRVNNIAVRAHHGCMDEEARIGGDYLVHVTITTDFAQAIATDELSDTVDYVAVHAIVYREMKIRSKLIEHVGGRIYAALKREIAHIDTLVVEVVKLSPPIGGDVASVAVTIDSSQML